MPRLLEACVSAMIFAADPRCAIIFHQDFTPIVDRDHSQYRLLFFRDHLPRDDVGMMFERREDHFVARLQELAAIGLNDQVNPFGRSANRLKVISLTEPAPDKVWTFCRAPS